MRRFWFALGSLCCASGVFAACGDVPEPPTGPTTTSTTGGGNVGTGGKGTGGAGAGGTDGGTDGGADGGMDGGMDGGADGGMSCMLPADCPSGVCSMGVCVGVTCTDHVKNGTETDVDCGGASCPGCIAGKMCVGGPDCVDGVCTAGLCQLPTCTDLVKNGNETGVDCGGGTCQACPNGSKCFVAADCKSGFCVGGACSQTLNGCDPATALDKTGQAAVSVAFGGAVGSMYSPSCLKLSVGTKVTFNGSFASHPLQGGVAGGGTATPATTGPLATQTSSGTTATFTMSSAGSYGFYCTVHWPVGMTGAMFVQ